MRWLLALLTVLALLVPACGNGGDVTTDGVDGAEAVDVGDASTEPAEDGSGDAGTDDGAADDGAADDGATDDGATDDGAADGADDRGDASQDPLAPGNLINPRTTHPVAAEPGRWAVGDAGAVEWDLTDEGLVLVEVNEADGWRARVDQDSADEIEVDFDRDSTRHQIEVEWDDGRLEIDVDETIRPADAGVFDLGQAGSVEIGVQDGRLILVDVLIADGWGLTIDEESADEIELDLRSEGERWGFEAELDDGELDVERDYRVSRRVER